jgi:lysozyme
VDRVRLLADIKASEGCRLVAYRDTLGFWTIGYGHLLPTDRDWMGYTIPQEHADEWLDQDLEVRGIRPAQGLPEWRFLDTDARQNAVVELCYNMGVGHWRAFAHTRLCIQNRNWQGAHDGLLASEWAKQVGPTRSQRLAKYLLTGTFE